MQFIYLFIFVDEFIPPLPLSPVKFPREILIHLSGGNIASNNGEYHTVAMHFYPKYAYGLYAI